MSFQRAEVIRDIVEHNSRDLFDLTDVKIEEHLSELTPDIYDPAQPTVAIYSHRTWGGADYLSLAAAKLRAEDVTVANFLNIVPGTYSDSFVDQPDSPLFIEAGYLYNQEGNVVIFDLDNPVMADCVDYGRSNDAITNLRAKLDELGVLSLRSADSYLYENKWESKQLLSQAGLNIARGVLVTTSEDFETPAYLSNGFVVKPAIGMMGAGVQIFNQAFSQELLDKALLELDPYKDAVIVEELIEELPLHCQKFPEGASWNLRVFGFNGYCGSYGRVGAKGQPVNVAGGGIPVHSKELIAVLAEQNGLLAEDLLQSIIDCANKVYDLIPNTAIGIDLLIGRDGKVYVIETNIADFGALQYGGFEEEDRLEAAMVMAKNITKFAVKINNNPDYQNSSPYSVVDSASFLWHSIGQELSQTDFDDKDFNEDAFIERYTGLLEKVTDLLEVQRGRGDDLYALSILDTVHSLALDLENSELADRAKALMDATLMGSRVKKNQEVTT